MDICGLPFLFSFLWVPPIFVNMNGLGLSLSVYVMVDTR